jgi:hypothetical protein
VSQGTVQKIKLKAAKSGPEVAASDSLETAKVSDVMLLGLPH